MWKVDCVPGTFQITGVCERPQNRLAAARYLLAVLQHRFISQSFRSPGSWNSLQPKLELRKKKTPNTFNDPIKVIFMNHFLNLFNMFEAQCWEKTDFCKESVRYSQKLLFTASVDRIFGGRVSAAVGSLTRAYQFFFIRSNVVSLLTTLSPVVSN